MSAAVPRTVANLLRETGAESGRLERELLLAAACGTDRAALYRDPERTLAPAAIAAFQALLAARRSGEPIAYLLGRREFWNLALEVGPDVLIPRPETELLVETALELMPRDAAVRVLDLGTGSGAIGLALAAERPNWWILASDCCPRALAVASRNAARHGLRNVALRRASWFDVLDGERFDLIVANPPYVASDDAALTSGDTRFEPRLALDGGRDGLQAIRSIVSGAPPHLNPRGVLALEHGDGQAADVTALLRTSGFRDLRTRRDLQAWDRLSLGTLGTS